MQVWSVAIILGVLNPLMNHHQPFSSHPGVIYIPLLYHECITILIHRKKSMPLTPGWSVASPILEAYREDDRKRDRR